MKNALMFRFIPVAAAAMACALPATPVMSFELCVDPGAPISASTGQIALNALAVKNTGAKWARVNFILGPWTSPNDTTRRGPGNLTWKETYDQIINNLVAQGIQPYALVGAEAVKSSAGGNLNSTQYVNDYTANFVTIVGHFKDRVRVYESFNEPNDWAGGTTSQVQPAWFAKMLREIYLGVKVSNGHLSDPSWQVTLVSGPLFSHDMDTCAGYMAQVYQAGISQHGWNTLKSTYGTYPLDGIGYHIYVRQGSTTEQDVTNGINTNLNAIWSTITTYEGAQTPKKLWLSEVGWATHYISETEQARNLTLAFNMFKNDVRVNLANWFCLVDFGPSAKYGLLRTMPDVEANRKPSWTAFKNLAQSLQPTGSMSGVITDSGGAALSGATVTSADGLYTATSAADGSYSIAAIAPGSITFTARKFGYRAQTRIVVINNGANATANFSLVQSSVSQSPGAAKGAVDNAFVRLNGLVVSAVFSDRIYAQTLDRSSGIGLLGAVSATGNLIDATGSAATVDGERVLTGTDVKTNGSAQPPTALYGSNKWLGGGAFAKQPGVIDDADAVPATGAIGLNNVGLLVRTAGVVTGVDPDNGFFYIDDGSELTDGSGNSGVRVAASGLSLPEIGHLVAVTGVSGVRTEGSNYVRVLRARSQSDIAKLNPGVDQPALANAGFEFGTSAGWTLYGEAETVHSGSWFGDIAPHSGCWFFGTATNEGVRSGGLYQQAAAQPGALYSASAWSRVYHGSNGTSAARNRVGIDPTGGANRNSANVVWSEWDVQETQWTSVWRSISSPPAVATGSTVTLFLDFEQSDNASWHINCFDDATLTAF